MGRKVVDAQQTEVFLKAAKEMGYQPNELLPVGHAKADASGTIIQTLTIGRRGKSKAYKNDSEWSKEAIADLKSGFFGKP